MKSSFSISPKSLFEGVLLIGAASMSWFIFSPKTNFWPFVILVRGLSAVAIFDAIFTPFKSHLKNSRFLRVLFLVSFLIKLLIIYTLKTLLVASKYVLIFGVLWVVFSGSIWGLLYLVIGKPQVSQVVFYGTTLLMIVSASYGNKVISFSAPYLRLDLDSGFDKLFVKYFLGQNQIRFAIYALYFFALTIQSAVQLSLINEGRFPEGLFPLFLQSFLMFLAVEVLTEKKHLIPGPRTIVMLLPGFLQIIWSHVLQRKKNDL